MEGKFFCLNLDRLFKVLLTYCIEGITMARLQDKTAVITGGTTGGSIVLNTTTLAQTALTGEAIYSASKAAVRSLARSFSMELLDRQIRVNAVAPGPIETSIWSKMELPPEVAESVLKRTPIGRFGKPEEIAKAVLFLASDDSSYMLGEEILVDGWSTL